MNIRTKILISNSRLRHAVYAAHKGECFYTGRKIGFEDMDIDHIVPVLEGGKNCIENYVPISFSLNRRKGCKIDYLLVERMLYINKIYFAPLILKYYLSLHVEEKGYTQLRIYLKHYYHDLLCHSTLICNVAKNNIPFLHKKINKTASRRSFLFKKEALNPFLLKCKTIFDKNDKVTQYELNRWIKMAGCDKERQDKVYRRAIGNTIINDRGEKIRPRQQVRAVSTKR